MVDASIVLIENAHKHLEAFEHRHGRGPTLAERWELVTDASIEVGPALFFSLLVITLSFVPVFTLEAQEGRLFSPLAFTKTYAMAAAAGLSVTLVPVLMGYLVRGRIPAEASNPLNRFLTAIYRPALEAVLRFPKATLAVAAVLLVLTAIPMTRLGGEFLPPLDEGDLLYMPSALPGLSASKASELLQQTDRLIKTVPEVERVFGKAGRADTATDPAPLEMFETTIQFKPRDQWRAGMTPDKLVEELDRVVKVPGLSNVWVPPIRNRIDMLATGIKSPVGIKVAGADLATIDRLTGQVEAAVKKVPGVSSALGRAAHRRPVHRRGRGPCRSRQVRPLGRRRAEPSCPQPSAGTTSVRSFKAGSASPSTCGTRGRFGTRWSGCGRCPSSRRKAPSSSCRTWHASTSRRAHRCCAARTPGFPGGSTSTCGAGTCVR